MNIRSKLKEHARVLRVTKKPDWEEFMEGSKITGLGIIVIGLIGFAVYMIGVLLRMGV